MRFFISGLFFVVLTITAVTANSAVDVVVIGAGASGITAASGLLKQGYRVKILDAENRIGGRLHSVPYGNGFVELGGQAVWGQNNTLYDYVRDEDLIAGGGPVPVPIGNAPGVANLADIGGEIKDERELAQINHVWAALHGALVNLDTFNNTNNISVGEYFDNAIADYIKNNNITDPGTVVLAQTVYDYVVRMLKTEDGLDSLHVSHPRLH
ncbi:hypothetical protein BV898_15994 [Hypsibius exemplaris]|uniref:Amine oxidase domain-containing protein n=1 Tax=Hypsibius exemplaris TaxID=2072580 RepID=A0A9X6RL31_HYPEX|nr:hypothetical protein BV898_15994 [Hypsibius exemplaris]